MELNFSPDILDFYLHLNFVSPLLPPSAIWQEQKAKTTEYSNK